MIRIKTFSFRQAIERMFFYIAILVIVILILLFSIVITCFFKDEIENMIIREENYSKEVFSKSMFIRKILDNELLVFSFQNDIKESDANENNLIYTKIFDSKEIEKISNESPAVIELKELPIIEYKIPEMFEVINLDNGKVKVGNARITNYSKLKLDLEELSKPTLVELNSDTDFLIFHTHATESYTVDSADVVNYRTTNEDYNMLSVGKTLCKELEMREFKTVHDKLLHDYPSYNGAYKHSLETVSKYLKNKEYEFVFDVHRDAISSDLTYGPVCEINGEKAAELMFVIGTNSAGAEHDKWIENLKLAIMIQNRANEMYPRII